MMTTARASEVARSNLSMFRLLSDLCRHLIVVSAVSVEESAVAADADVAAVMAHALPVSPERTPVKCPLVRQPQLLVSPPLPHRLKDKPILAHAKSPEVDEEDEAVAVASEEASMAVVVEETHVVLAPQL
jgi:hypothetical protein